MKTYTFLLEVRDTPGVLVRIAHVFSRRGGNIRSLHVQPHADAQWSTMTISAERIIKVEHIKQQLEKLIDVQSVAVHEHRLKEN